MSDTINASIKEADILTGKPNTIAISDGREIEIYTAKLKQTGEILRFLSFLMGKLGINSPDTTPKIDINNPVVITMFIAENVEHIYPIASSLCSLSVDEIEELELDDALAIGTKIWEVNKGFFLQKILPMLSTTTPMSPTSKVSKKKRSTRKKRAS